MADDFLEKWGINPNSVSTPPDVGVGPTQTYDFNSKWGIGESPAPVAASPDQPHKFGLADTWPARLLKAIGMGLAAPGNALKSTPENPVTTGEMIEPAANLASTISTGGIPSVLSKSTPLIDPSIARLMQTAREEYGIPVRGSQFAPGMKRTDLAAANKPFTGIAESDATQQSAFNRIINKAMGVDANKVNRDVIDQVKENYGHAIEDITDRVGKLKLDDATHSDILDTFKQASINMPDKIQVIQNKIKEIAKNVNENGEMDAKTYKGLMRKGGPLDSSIYTDGVVAHHVDMLKDNMKDLLKRNASKEDVAALDKWNERYAIMKSIEPLAEKSATGDISPPSLMRVTPSYGKLSDLARIGQVMKSASSSGTAENLSAIKKFGLTSGLGALEGLMLWHDPIMAAKVTAGALGAGALKALGNKAYGSYLRSDYLANRLINRSLPEKIGPLNPIQKLISGSAVGYLPAASSVPELNFPVRDTVQ